MADPLPPSLERKVSGSFCATSRELTGPSMSPTINSKIGDTDIALAEHISILTNRLKRNDVVLLIDPNDAEKCLCKRIKAMEGDKISGSVFSPFRHTRVPRGHVWLEGDNIENSHDSRMFGPVPKALIKSRVFYKLWESVYRRDEVGDPEQGA